MATGVLGMAWSVTDSAGDGDGGGDEGLEKGVAVVIEENPLICVV